ncbi:MAG: M12 family metallo-peptidase [Phycisphaerales bacterium]|jgi:hypothetical protein|nr:M12 family metallo-peptidase [Phycisphaerales bacterium]
MIKKNLIATGIVFCVISQIVWAASVDPVFVDSPLTIHNESAPRASRDFATRLHLDISKLDLASDQQFVFIEDFPLDKNRRVTLQLEEASAIEHDATFVVMRNDKRGRLVEEELQWPKCFVFRGTVVGEPTSDVFLAIGEEIANGWISIDGTRFIIGTRYADRMTLLYDEANVPEGMIKWSKYECGVKSSAEDLYSDESSERSNRIPDECPQAQIAIDTDSEFTIDLFGGSETAAADYVNTLVSAVSDIYKGAITVGGQGVRLKVVYLRLWSVSDDPWTGTNTDTALAEFSDYWRTNMGDVERHLAHNLSGRNLGGGIANLFGLCNDGYAVSGGLAGTFPMPLEGEQAGNWDPIVFAHETGHNFGMIHTHEMEEPPDGCGNGDCASASGATIMSYCHLCDGGVANIAFEFHDDNVDSAEAWLTTVAGGENCNMWPNDPPLLEDDRAFTDMNTPVAIHVLDNDVSNSCNNMSLVTFDQRARRGGTVTQSAYEELTYTPTGTFSGTDSFTYTASNGSYSDTANVVIEITRPPPGGGGTDPIDPNDVIFVITLWGTRSADCTGDGTTNIDDLLAVLEGRAKPDRRLGGK